MKSSVASRLRKRKTLDAAAQEFRAAQGSDRDEILAARRALRRAERTQDLAVDRAEREVEALTEPGRPGSEAAEGRLAAARVERLGIEEAKPLLERIAGLAEHGERVLDMAPGISTGHDGVLVVTDRRLLFVGLRHTLRLPYEAIQDVIVRGRRFGSRLIITTPGGKSVVSGIDSSHAPEIAALAGRYVTGSSPR